MSTLFRLSSIFITVTFSLGLVCCNNDQEAISHLDVAENIINSRPDLALSILDSIKPETIRGNNTKARYALLFSIALDKNYVDTTTFDILQPAIDYYLKKGSPDEKLKTYYYQGRIYQNRNENDSAMQSFVKGKDFFIHCSDSITMANLLVAQGTLFYTTYKFNEFIENNLLASKLYESSDKRENELKTLGNILDGCILLGYKSLADSIYIIANDKISHNKNLTPIIEPYLLSYVMEFGSDAEIRNVINNTLKHKNLDELDKIDIAYAYFKIGDKQKALQYLNTISPDSQYAKSLRYLAIKSDILEHNGDYEQAIDAYKSYYAEIDSIHQNIFSHDLLFVEKRHEIEKANLIAIQKKNRIIWFSIGAVLLCLIVTLYIYYRYRLGKAKSLLDARDKEKLKLASEANALKVENLEYQLIQLTEERDSLRNLLTEERELEQPVQDAIKIRLDMLNKLLATHISDNVSLTKQYEEWRDRLLAHTDEFMNSTRLAYKVTHPGFIEYLEQQELSEDEINEACLYAIGLRGKDILNYTQKKRLYHSSSNIRKKLGIDEHQTNLSIYIRNLLKQF